MSQTPPAERKVACKVCRRRKTACDRARPKCGICTKAGLLCEYAERGRHAPGLRAGYVQSLERRIDGLEQRLESLEARAPEQMFPDTILQATPEAHLNGQSHRQYTDESQEARPSTQGTGYFSGFMTGMPAAANPHPAASNTSQSTNDRASENGIATDPLALPVIQELCETWFRRYHRWFPILHRPTFMHALHTPESANFSRYLLVAKAVVVVTLQHSHRLANCSSGEREQSQTRISSSVIIDCMNTRSVQAAQALLVLSVFHYGEGNFMQSWNLLAMARRISAHLGTTAERHTNIASSPTALRRLADFTNTTIAGEESIRAYWMSHTLEGISTVGAPYELALSTTPGDPLLPCSDAFWDDPDPLIGERQMRPYSYCSAFAMCVILAASELSTVHQFLRRPVNFHVFEERDTWQVEAQRLDERLTAWRDEFVAAVFRLINAEYSNRERPEMDANVVLTNCVLNTAVITLLQRRAACPQGIDQEAEPWPFANMRCLYACENTAFKVRQMDEDELLVSHPHLIFSIFVAARFYIVHSKAMDASVPTNLHCLAFALHTTGKRWPLARHCERILRIAVGEYRTPVAISSLPVAFYDLRLSTFEIMEALIDWVRGPGANSDVGLQAEAGHNGSMIFTPMSLNPLT